MDEISLVMYLKVNEKMATVVFPREAESVIDKEDLKSSIILENDKHPQGQVITDFLYQFLEEINQDADSKNNY